MTEANQTPGGAPDQSQRAAHPEQGRKVEAETVEAVVRQQLSKALGGRRGMAEAAVPTILFTLTWLTQRDLDLALMVSVGAALVLLAIRLVQRSTVQFVVNALFGIAIGWYFVHRSAASGGSEQDQALAYFLPGILYNGGYAVVLAFTCLIGWPLQLAALGSMVWLLSRNRTPVAAPA